MKMVKVKALAFACLVLTAMPAMAADGADAGQYGENAAIPMAIISWICFFSLLLVGGKIAWKPILANLDAREKRIRESLENADRIDSQLADTEASTKKLISDAETSAKTIITEAKETAQKLAKEINDTAKAEAQSLRDNALKDIENARAKAVSSLRDESAELAVTLAGKLIGENLDSEKSRVLTDKIIDTL